ncbi:MAG TPA: NAD-dependent epimerase/dehydratase family protein [Candidatus Binataceae bacterium]|nr:NAD-dependent epimerase/dehydratase family protein [Candidatus Binataceae bacterium]
MSLAGRAIAVTGANGFLGAALCKMLTENGASVRALVRNPLRHQSLRAIASAGVYRFDLASEIDDESLAPTLDTVIHCAYVIDDRDRERSNHINLEGTRRLLQRSRQNGVGQFVFISSLAAHQNARSGYGRSKWLLENEIAAGFTTIIKPGTIVGPGGVFQRLRGVIRKAPLLPVFYARHRVQTIYIEDLCEAILQSLIRRTPGRLVLAEPDGVSMREFYRGVARLEGKLTPMLSFPGDLALMLAKTAETLSLPTPVSSDNLLGIKYVQYFDSRPTSDLLGITPRSYWSALSALAGTEIDRETISSSTSIIDGAPSR